jgi:hypothetical protein
MTITLVTIICRSLKMEMQLSHLMVKMKKMRKTMR